MEQAKYEIDGNQKLTVALIEDCIGNTLVFMLILLILEHQFGVKLTAFESGARFLPEDMETFDSPTPPPPFLRLKEKLRFHT